MIGIDLVSLNRVSLEETWIQHILTNEEMKELSGIKLESRKIAYVGGRFAVKEAIFKATQDLSYLSFSCLHDEKGKPYILDHPEIEVSISHDDGYAVAMVLVKENYESN